jgi:hypothetical protein
MTPAQAFVPPVAAEVAQEVVPAFRLMASAWESVAASQRATAALVTQSAALRVFADAAAPMRRLAEAITAEARREVAAQYRRALLARAAQAHRAQDRRAVLARRALTEQGPTLTYLLALNGDQAALETLRERARSDAFAAEVLEAVEACERSTRALALTVWAVAVSLTYLDAVTVLAARWSNPRPSRTPDLLRHSLDRMAPPASAQRPADRPTVGSAYREPQRSTSTPIQEYRRIKT